MKRQKYIAIILTIVMNMGCSIDPEKEFENDKTFPKVQKLLESDSTTFLPTLETPFETTRNGVYAASLLYVWDEIKNEISEPISNITGEELSRINASKSYENTLLKNEYSSSVEIKGLSIYAKAFFGKSLPFVTPFEKEDKPLQFLNNEVMSFGFYGYREAAKIEYYKNDNDFAIKLLPKDDKHEIILIMSNFAGNLNIANEIERIETIKKEFRKKQNEKNSWKYWLNDEDRVSIPIIEFNIETYYTEIEGSSFSTSRNRLIIEEVYQRTAFILNEKGAEIESEAEIELVVEEEMEEMEEELPKPKTMIFDKPYLILLKRKDNKYPYFAMFVSNSELMKKE